MMTENTQAQELKDIRGVSVDKTLPKQERLIEYVRQIQDPYHFKCGLCTITAFYPENGQSFEDCLRGAIT